MAARAVGAGAVHLERTRFTMYHSNMHSLDWRDPEERQRDAEKAKNKGKGYGVSAQSGEQARSHFKKRAGMLDVKLTLCDWTVFLSLAGLSLAIVDVELCAFNTEFGSHHLENASTVLRCIIIGLTFLLQLVLLGYHLTDIRVYLIETNSESWRVGLTFERIVQVLAEIAACACCPIPAKFLWKDSVVWPFLSGSPLSAHGLIKIPTHVLLTLPMFLRLYLVGRYMVLHSRYYQDCATKTIASLNRVAVDFRFVIRSELYQRPLLFIFVFTICFWMVMAWMVTQCERYAYPNLPGYQHLLDFIWFEIITFFSIGYGDIKVHTYCGRALAMVTALVGTIFSSILIALMARRMALSSSEKRVNHLIAESQLSLTHKNCAARVLQNTWRTVLKRREVEKEGPGQKAVMKLRAAQRALLRAILEFRRSRWRLRMQMEDEDDYFIARRAFMETEERLSRVRKRQTQLNQQIGGLYEHVQSLTHLIHLRSC
ncbi:unnamed protein product, partial [Mesorhabditis belari]|uniref:Calmodulin-binding domain-containing protein n=1 Tax=Mesorhabditis belari TaxID=2138241 RepID=A0AAF3JC37_9BILA